MSLKSKYIVLIILGFAFYANAPAAAASYFNESPFYVPGGFNYGYVIDDGTPDAAAYKKAYKLVLDEKWNSAVKELNNFLRQTKYGPSRAVGCAFVSKAEN